MSRKAAIAVIGAGWWASTVHLPALVSNDRARLVAVCDPDEPRAKLAASIFAAPRSYTDVGEMIDSENLDGVIVATPHTTHYDIVVAALKAGIHVLVEKPMTTSAGDAWRLVDLAAKSGRILAVGLTYQYSPTASRVRSVVRHEIGELVSINAEFSSNTHSLFATVDPAEAHLDEPSMPHGTSYSDPSLSGGGQGHTQLTHLLGGMLWAAGTQATEVAAFMDNRDVPVDVVDALTFQLSNGALGAATSAGTTPPGVPVRHRLRFHGTGGMVEWDMLRADAWIYRSGGRIERVQNSEHQPAYASAEVSGSFVGMLLDGGANLAPPDFAAASVSLIEAAYISARSGRIVPVRQGPISDACVI